jgi:glycosyltransferase involved in cell wall biosynthesis
MRLLFVHEVNWARKVVYEIHDYPELLSMRGHEVVFIDFAEDDHPRGVARLVDLRTSIRSGMSRAHDGSAVEVRTPGRVLSPPFDRPAASLTQVPAIWRALSRERFDAVVLYGVPTNGWQTVQMARHIGVPVLFRSIDVSHSLRTSAYSRMVKLAEQYVATRADAISTHNVALRRYLVSIGADPARISVNYPGLDLNRFQPGPRNAALAAKYGIASSDRVVLFMGTLYRFSGLDWFLDAAAPALRARPAVKLVLVGGGEAAADLRARCRKLGLEDSVIFTGVADYPELAEHLRLGDVAINPFRPEAVTHCALPGKILQYLGCGLPTVCTPLEGMQGMVQDPEGIVYREPGEAFVSTVIDLVDDEQRRSELAKAGRGVMERLCDWDVAVTSFEHAISSMVERHRSSGSRSRWRLSPRSLSSG